MTLGAPAILRITRDALRARGLDLTDPPITLGEITLLPHQVAAVHWLRARLARVGGALLADPPGLGKTFTALAVAATAGVRPLVIAPATLRARWLSAAASMRIGIDVVSTERLSAPAPLAIAKAALVIIDEAHHLRSPATRRHQRTTELCADAQVLLLSATPIHNAERDLAHITALFHHAHGHTGTGYIRRRLTLRRTLDQIHAATPDGADTGRLPHIRHRGTITTGAVDATLVHDIASLPQLHSDTPDAHRLLTGGLLHALRSSTAALRARCDHRIAACLAIEHAIQAHVAPDPAIRRAFSSVGGDTQLAMAALLGIPGGDVDPEIGHSAERQRLALAELRRRSGHVADRRRASVLRRLARWSAQPVVAFTQFTATAAVMYDALSRETGIALLHGAGARIATGSITRQEVLDRLLVARYRARHDRVRLLITTDVLSEGLSLSGVATVVHLDLPWTAARLDQRIGRAARIGAGVPAVNSVLLTVPVTPEADATLLALLARKRRAMGRFTGQDGDHVPMIRILCALQRRHAPADDVAPHPSPSVWCTVATRGVTVPTVIAVVRVGGRRCVVAASRGTLRRPSVGDWQALEAGRVTPAGRGGWVARVRRWLRAWEADRELTTTLTARGGPRLTARRSADEGLRQASRAVRAAESRGVSHARRVQQVCHRPGELALAEWRLTGERGSATPWPVSRLSRRSPGVKVYAGVVLVPEP